MMIHRRAPRSLLLAGMLLWASRALLSETPAAALKEMSLSKDGDKLSVQLKIEGAYTVEASFLPAPPRLVVDLTPMPRIQIPSYTQIDDIGVLDVRTGQFTPETVRVVFDLSQNVPAYTIVQNVEGLKISFWYEGEVPPLEAPVREAEAKPGVKPTAPAAAPAEPEIPGRSNFFVAARTGLSLFLGGDMAVDKNFDLYGETGTLDEAYSFSARPVFELQFGKYLNRIKLGLGVTAWSIKEPGAFTASLPHPFLADSNRTVSFQADDMKYPSWSFSAFALFSLLETDTIGLSAGPMIGLTMGKTSSLNDFNFTERSPFTSADIVVSDLTFVEEKFTEFLFGGLLGLEYRPTESLSILFDLRLNYLNPKNVNLNQRINLLHFQPVLGIQYNF